ncbi:hypothetical protein E3N88_42384 [Mikania micrantha]|uniref:FAR1 domain-containing protein n=1 Tax=Mikania micrantha TaxID=192012 RepID=A0A5N6LHX0_9ASTR|nr:hypothetical protein E3N88_42384 [Mikania micrantha]
MIVRIKKWKEGRKGKGVKVVVQEEPSAVFAGIDELVDWAIARGRENGYVLVRRRSKTNATGVVIKVWLKCDRGGVYQGEPKARRTGSKKTGCEFELIGKYERSCGGWKLRVLNNEHNHQGAEQLGGHPYAMRLNESETRLGMMRWMTERMAASAGMDAPVFPGPGHHQDPQDPGGHA